MILTYRLLLALLLATIIAVRAKPSYGSGRKLRPEKVFLVFDTKSLGNDLFGAGPEKPVAPQRRIALMPSAINDIDSLHYWLDR